MGDAITLRDLDPRDREWLEREAKCAGLSIEAVVRRTIHERRVSSERREKLSKVVTRLFGPEHGVELRARAKVSYRPVEFD